MKTNRKNGQKTNEGIVLRVGVTGHRDIPEQAAEAALTKCRELLSSLQQRMPATEIVAVTGMADGADRIFARAAESLGISIEAVLPMPLVHYRADFDEESWLELQSLLDLDTVSTLELPLGEGVNEDMIAWPNSARDALYANLSEYLLARSNILVALWDGQSNHLKGGTSYTLFAYLGMDVSDNSHAVRLIDAGQRTLAGRPVVCWIPVERSSSPAGSPGITSDGAAWISAVGEDLQEWSDIPTDLAEEITALDEFNQQYLQRSRKGLLTSYGNLVDEFNEVLGENAQDYRELDQAYVMSDSLALYYQRQSDRLFMLFALMAAAMGLLFLVYAKLAAAQILLVGYLILFFAGVYLNTRGGKQHWFTRHLVYRCLAEISRVRFYLHVSSTSQDVDIEDLLDTTGINKFSGFSWIRHVLRSAAPKALRQPTPSSVSDVRVESVRKHWIEDQSGYFRRKAHELHLRHQKLERIKQWVIGGLVVSAIVLVFFKKTLVGVEVVPGVSLKTLLVFAMGLFPFWLGVWEIYQGKMAIKELLWQYQKQWELFSATNRDLEHATGQKTRRKLISGLAKSSILETFMWLSHRFHREHEPPTAG